MLPMASLPHEVVPLHIFEPRYKALIKHCMQEREQGGSGEFVLLHSFGGDKVAPVGCTMRVLKVIKQFEDGRMDIITTGRRRINLQGADGKGTYPVARIEYLEDESRDWDEKLATKAFNLHRQLVEAITGAKPGDSVYAGISGLSFVIGSSIHLDIKQKLQLLANRSEDERLELLIKWMKQLLRQLAVVQNAVRSIQGYWELQKIIGEMPRE